MQDLRAGDLGDPVLHSGGHGGGAGGEVGAQRRDVFARGRVFGQHRERGRHARNLRDAKAFDIAPVVGDVGFVTRAVHAGDDGGVAVGGVDQSPHQQSADVKERCVRQHHVAPREGQPVVGRPLTKHHAAVRDLDDLRVAGGAAGVHVAGDALALRRRALKRQLIAGMRRCGGEQVMLSGGREGRVQAE